jgi:dUTP pyrophosphatase
MIVKFKRLHADAKLPTYGTRGAACFDFYALSDVGVPTFNAGSVRTGLAVEIPQGHCMLIFGRSGLAMKYGLRLANSVGVIDSDYRGEVIIRLHNDSDTWQSVMAGERVAQGLIVPSPYQTLVEVDELSDTARGTGGFGSTGR